MMSIHRGFRIELLAFLLVYVCFSFENVSATVVEPSVEEIDEDCNLCTLGTDLIFKNADLIKDIIDDAAYPAEKEKSTHFCSRANEVDALSPLKMDECEILFMEIFRNSKFSTLNMTDPKTKQDFCQEMLICQGLEFKQCVTNANQIFENVRLVKELLENEEFPEPEKKSEQFCGRIMNI